MSAHLKQNIGLIDLAAGVQAADYLGGKLFGGGKRRRRNAGRARFYVSPAPTIRGWYVKKVVTNTEGKEIDGGVVEKLGTKSEAKARALQLNAQAKKRGLYLPMENPSATPVPFFCADCEVELHGKSEQQRDGRHICHECARRLRERKQARSQGDLFVEQTGLFDNPAATIDQLSAVRIKLLRKAKALDARGDYRAAAELRARVLASGLDGPVGVLPNPGRWAVEWRKWEGYGQHAPLAGRKVFETEGEAYRWADKKEDSNAIVRVFRYEGAPGQGHWVKVADSGAPSSNPATDGFVDKGGNFHPIRASEGYNEFKTTDVESPSERKERAARNLARKTREYNDDMRRQDRARIKTATSRALHKRAGMRTLSQFVRAMGGIVPGGMYAGEIRRLGKKETGTTGLVNQHARQGRHKQTAEYVMNAANVEGYKDRHGARFTAIGDFLAAVEEDASGHYQHLTDEDHDKLTANNPSAPDEWDDLELDEAARLGSQQARALGSSLRGRKVIRNYEVTWYSPATQKTVTLSKTIQAHNAAGAVAQAKVAIGFSKLKRKAPALVPVNFVAREVAMSNPKLPRHVQLSPKEGREIIAEHKEYLAKTWDNTETENRAFHQLAHAYQWAGFSHERAYTAAGRELEKKRRRNMKNPSAEVYDFEQGRARLNPSRAITRLALEGIHYVNTGRGAQFLKKAIAEAERERDTLTGKERTDATKLIIIARRELKKKNPAVPGARSEVRSPTRTSTEVRSPTKTSTWAKTTGNITVTGGAGAGATTKVIVRRSNPYYPSAKLLSAHKKVAEKVTRISKEAQEAYNAGDEAKAKRLWAQADKLYSRLVASTERASTAKRNPGAVDAMSKKFQGRVSGGSVQLKAAASAPSDLARIGKLCFLKLAGQGRALRVPGAMVAASSAGKLWIVGDRAPLFNRKAKPGEGLNYGEIASICYVTAKKHIGAGKTFEYEHKFGEEGGKRPSLIVDAEGMPIIRGGSYTISAEGIVN